MAQIHLVSAYLRRTVSEPFVWGVSDCVMWATGAIVAVGGADPMSGLRGSYSGPMGAYKIMNDEGGMVAMFDARMSRQDAGWGVCVVEVLGRLTAGVVNGGHVVVKSTAGQIIVPAAPIGVWR